MINPDTIVVDVEEQRDWLINHKLNRGLSWAELSKAIGRAAGTLSQFGGRGGYTGDNRTIAEEVFRYRQTLETQAVREVGLKRGPGYFETQTSRRLKGLMILAHGGRITLAATSPGTGKTETMRHYAASASNVTCVTIRESTKTLSAMMSLVLRSMGKPSMAINTAQLSDAVIGNLRGRRALLIFDEANHLSLAQFEEIRAWHDAEGVECGLCFLGNEELLLRITAGQRSDAFARLNSRIASSHVQTLPLPEDVEDFCDAWEIADREMCELLKRIALTPAAGGLRECAQIVEQASAIAADEGRALSYADLREAKATRATRNIL